MKKSNFAVAGALITGMLMIVLFVGFTSEKLASTNDNSIEAIQSNDNVLAEAIIFDGKCGDDKNAEKEGKEMEKAEKKSEGKCGDDKAIKKEAKDEEKVEKVDAKNDKNVEKEGATEKSEGKCGEGKCGEGKCGI